MPDPIEEIIEAENRIHAEDEARRRQDRDAVLIAVGGVMFFLLWWLAMQV